MSVTGSPVETVAVESVSLSPGSKHAMSWIRPVRSSAHRTRPRMPVLIASGEPASTACRIEVSAPSSFTSAQANGWLSGWPSMGSGIHDQLTTVPVSETSTKSVIGSCVAGSNSGGGTWTRPSEPRAPMTFRSRRAVTNAPMVGPTDRV